MHAVANKYQQRFLKWAKAKKGCWPEAKRGKYRIAPTLEQLLDYYNELDGFGTTVELDGGAKNSVKF